MTQETTYTCDFCHYKTAVRKDIYAAGLINFRGTSKRDSWEHWACEVCYSRMDDFCKPKAKGSTSPLATTPVLHTGEGGSTPSLSI